MSDVGLILFLSLGRTRLPDYHILRLLEEMPQDKVDEVRVAINIVPICEKYGGYNNLFEQPYEEDDY